MTNAWKQCLADVQTYRHHYTLLRFQDEVVLPAIAALDARIQALGEADYLGHEFDKADMEVVRCETLLAFTLSIQSIWERQLRMWIGVQKGPL